MAVTVAGWIAYAAERGTIVADNADAAAALVRAGDVIEYRYLANLRADVSRSSIESIIDAATYIAASYELATPGFFSKTYTPSQQKVLTAVEGIKWTATGSASSTYAEFPTSSLIAAMFEPYIIDRDGPNFAFRSIGGCA